MGIRLWKLAKKNMRKSNSWLNSSAIILLMSLASTEVLGQTAEPDSGNERSDISVLMDEVVVTARERKESLQDVPLAITGLSSAQIEAKKIRSLDDLTVGIPNVSFDDVGTTPGTAKFSIRGLGINSSIPSIDPTVGTFVDGVYIGTNSGLVFDIFDLEGIEVLRGPQGTLFGRNVTGGAVLLKTKKPGDEVKTRIQLALKGGGDGGLNTYIKGSVGGPVSDVLALKLFAYFNDDQGWFENDFDGERFGARQQLMLRPMLVWSPSDQSELILRYEYSDVDGDGPAGQSHTNGSGIPGSPANFERDSFNFSIDNRGYVDVETHFATAEYNQSVGDSGQITNIFGYRKLSQDTLTDLDAQPLTLFDGRFQLESEQVSNELRYAGKIGEAVDIVAGLYYFKNDIICAEGRNIFGGALTQDGGGEYSVESFASFVSSDYALNDDWTLSTGLR